MATAPFDDAEIDELRAHPLRHLAFAAEHGRYELSAPAGAASDFSKVVEFIHCRLGVVGLNEESVFFLVALLRVLALGLGPVLRTLPEQRRVTVLRVDHFLYLGEREAEAVALVTLVVRGLALGLRLLEVGERRPTEPHAPCASTRAVPGIRLLGLEVIAAEDAGLVQNRHKRMAVPVAAALRAVLRPDGARLERLPASRARLRHFTPPQAMRTQMAIAPTQNAAKPHSMIAQ